jgi:hypothetical protein
MAGVYMRVFVDFAQTRRDLQAETRVHGKVQRIVGVIPKILKVQEGAE